MSKAALPKELQADIEQFDQSLQNLEEKLKPLLDITLPELTADMSEVDVAKLYLLLAYTMDTLFFGRPERCLTSAYLRTQGVDPLEHEVKEELDRIKKYMGKLKKMTEDQSGMLGFCLTLQRI